MAEGNSFVGADTSIYNKLMAPAQPIDPLGQAGKVVELQRQSNALDMSQLDKHTQHLQFIAGQIAPLVQLGASVTPEQITKQVMDTVTSSGGKVSPDEASQFMSRILTYPGGPAAGLQATQIQVLDGLNRIATMRGNTIATSTGGGTQYSQQNAFNGAMTPTPGGYVPNTLSPGEKTNPVNVYRNGQKGMVPAGQMYDQYGNLRQSGAAAPAPAAPAGVVAQPTAPAPSATAATMAPKGFIPTEPPIGVAEATNRTAAQSADQGGALQTMADAAPTRKGILTNLEGDLKNFNSGPVADLINQGKATFNQVGQLVGLPAGAQFDPQAIASQENFRKQATMLQQQQSQALGGTDAALASAGHSNPNTSFSKLGNEQVIQVLKGNEDAINAKNSAWQKWKQTHGPDTFGGFQEDFNKNYDPRAFQFPYMSPAQRAQVLADLPNNNQRAAFKQKVIDAVNKGYIKPPGAQ